MFHHLLWLVIVSYLSLYKAAVFHPHNFWRTDVHQLYEEFKQTYGKSFPRDEEQRRFEIFRENLQRARAYQEVEQGTARYGVTRFSDLTPDEFRQIYATATYATEQRSFIEKIPVRKVHKQPESFDWRDSGAVGPVADQGRCGSCWAFSAIGNIEGQLFVKTGHLRSLSVQEILDCDRIDHGCAGGSPPQAFKAAIELGGLELDADYSYVGYEGQCRADPSRFIAHVNGSTMLPDDEVQIAQHLFTYGPLSVGVNSAPLQYYISGIIHPASTYCDPTELDQSVLAIGFGSEQNITYWILKNSWGSMWGEQGFFRLHRGNGTCGVNQAVYTAQVT